MNQPTPITNQILSLSTQTFNTSHTIRVY